MKEITVDLGGKVLGRACVEIANVLIGKNDPTYAPNVLPDVFVVIKNLDKMKIEPKKLIANKYYTHSGYLGSLKEMSLGEMLEKDRLALLKTVVAGMLPKNKLRPERIKRIRVA